MVWQDTLRTVLEYVYDPLEKDGVGWAVCGSTATALQGCRLTPHGLNLLAQEPPGVYRFAELLRPFAAPDSPEVRQGMGDVVLSTPSVPVQIWHEWGALWHGARFVIDRTDASGVGIAHIAPPQVHEFNDRGIVWENGPALWRHLRRVAFASYSVPVVPLEFQVGTNLDRGRTKHGEDCMGRVREIARVFRENGYDCALLEWALDAAHLARFDEIMRTQ
ncbi:MAG: hypothetical protein JSV79_00010 [Armatimonadota bacterium]|nr:MAG: hypothetical protein JSV79_00010 [Armatimonadota bacterium]